MNSNKYFHVPTVALSLFILGLLFITPSYLFINAAAPTTNLSLYWNFDQSSGTIVNDSSLVGNNGTLINGPVWTAGKIGSGALSFDGVNDRITTSSDFIGAGPITVCMWIFTPTVPSENFISNGKFILATAYNYRLSLKSNGVTTASSAVNALVPNTWSHICITRDQSGVTNIYKNGVISGTANQNSGIPQMGTSNVVVGANINGSGPFVGTMDELRMYSRVLSSSEILEVYNDTGATTSPPETIPPVLSSGSPSGLLPATTTQVTLSVTTDENATCKYSTFSGIAYPLMINTFSITGSTTHSQIVSGLTEGSQYSYYVRCQDGLNNQNTTDYPITFSTDSALSSPIVVDAYIDMEAGNNGEILTTNILSAGTHGIGGAWSINPASGFTGLSVSTSSFAENTLPVPIQVRGGSTYIDNGTRGWVYDQTISNQNVSFSLPQNYNILSIGGFTQFNSVSIGGANENWDHLILSDGTGQGVVMQQNDYTGANNVRVHVSNHLGSSAGPGIPIIAGKTYWYTMQWNKYALKVYLTLYDPVDWSLVGSVSDDIISDSTNDATIDSIIIGEDHSLSKPFYQYWDDLVIDWTTAVYPLVPSTVTVPIDLTPPVISNGAPSGVLSSGTTQTTISVTTDENATCKYSTTGGVSYSSMTNSFTTTGGNNHSSMMSGLTNGGSYTYYVKCQDLLGNSNTSDYLITFSITSSMGPTLIGHWKFDEGLGTSALDFSGNNNNLLLLNGPVWTAGKIGSGALSFDGVNDTATASSSALLNMRGAFSVAFWVYKNVDFSSNTCLVLNGLGSVCSTLPTAFQYAVSAGGVGAGIKFSVSNGTAVLKSEKTSGMTNGAWYHVVATYNGLDTTSLYVNGVLVDTDTAVNFGPLIVFNNFGLSKIAFRQYTLDDVRLYNGVLSPSEVVQLYQMTP